MDHFLHPSLEHQTKYRWCSLPTQYILLPHLSPTVMSTFLQGHILRTFPQMSTQNKACPDILQVLTSPLSIPCLLAVLDR